MFPLILWLVAHSEELGATVLSVAAGEAGGVSRVLGLHNRGSVDLPSHLVGLGETHDGVGPGGEQVRLVGVDGCEETVQQEEIVLLVVFKPTSDLSWLVVEVVGERVGLRVGERVGCSQTRVEPIVEDVGVGPPAHHCGQEHQSLDNIFSGQE